MLVSPANCTFAISTAGNLNIDLGSWHVVGWLVGACSFSGSGTGTICALYLRTARTYTGRLNTELFVAFNDPVSMIRSVRCVTSL